MLSVSFCHSSSDGFKGTSAAVFVCAFFCCRLGLLDASLFGGLVVGAYLSAPLFLTAGQYGFLTVFSASAAFYLLGFLCVTFMPESVNMSHVTVSELNINEPKAEFNVWTEVSNHCIVMDVCVFTHN
jgi:hypothetical protein